MDRTVVKVSESHDHEIWRHEGAQERDRRSRVYPRVLPAGFHYEIAWLDDMTFRIGLVPDHVPVDAAGEPMIPKPAAILPEKHPSVGSVEDVRQKEAQARAARIHDLSKKKKNDLMTMAAEVGAEVTRSLSEARMAGLIVEAEEKRAAEEKEKAGATA